MAMTETKVAINQAAPTGIIDCDVHPMPRGIDEIHDKK